MQRRADCASPVRGLQPMRDILRGHLGRSFRAFDEEHRLSAAWTVSCGSALAKRGTVAGYDNSVLQIEVEGAVWMGQMRAMASTLARQIAQTSGLPVQSLHFTLRKEQAR
ncbi:MAG: DUF721 domain-containing protein [Acidobacteriota bacterium]|nr:DUF721 domain-containing protein [Acidobacteriota bacterium]